MNGFIHSANQQEPWKVRLFTAPLGKRQRGSWLTFILVSLGFGAMACWFIYFITSINAWRGPMWPIVMVLVAFPWLIVVVSVTRQFRCYTCIFEDHLEKQGLFRFKVIYYKDIYRWSVTSPSISESISLSSSGSDRTFYEGKLYLRAISSTGKWQKVALGTWYTDCGWIFAQLAYRMEYGDWVTGYF